MNSEREERLFGQARRVSSSSSSRHPDSVIKTILLRIQGRNLVKGSSQTSDQGRVGKLAEKLDNYSGSIIKKDFIEKRIVSWQCHLEEFLPFLSMGQEYGGMTLTSHILFLMVTVIKNVIARAHNFFLFIVVH